MNYLTLSLPYGNYHSVSIDDFKVYSDSVFVDDLWITSDIAFLTIPCVNHDSIFAIDFMCRSRIHWCCRFHTSAVTQFSLMISRSRVSQFLLTISSQYWWGFYQRFHASPMNVFSLLISCVHRELVFAVDSMCHPPSIFNDDFSFYSDSDITNNFCISSDKAFLPIPFVSHDSIFAIDLIRRSGIHWRCRFQTAVVTQYSLMISGSTGTLFSLKIYGSAVTKRFWQFHVSAMTLFLLSIWYVGREFIDTIDSIRELSLSFQWWFLGLESLSFHSQFLVSIDVVSPAIPCVNDDSVFSTNFICPLWISFHCRFHVSSDTQFSMMISRSTVTQFSPTISASVVT